VDNLGISPEIIEQATIAEATELKRREQAYLEGRSGIDLTAKTVILVDDGVATGATLRAAIAILKQSPLHDIVVAVPVAHPTVLDQLRQDVSDVVCLVAPERLQSISLWYDKFDQTSDETVKAILRQYDFGE